MSRSGYTDDLDSRALTLWRGAVNRAMRGRRGQAFLRELVAALDAMPEKVLISHELIDSDGDCCAIGAVCKSRGLDVATIDAECPSSVGRVVGIARAMAAEIEYENDEAGCPGETPAERWTRVRRWAADSINGAHSP